MICIDYSPVVLHILLSSLVIMQGNLKRDKDLVDRRSMVSIASQEHQVLDNLLSQVAIGLHSTGHGILLAGI